MRPSTPALLLLFALSCGTPSCTTQKYASLSFSDSKESKVKKAKEKEDEDASTELTDVIDEINAERIEEAPYFFRFPFFE